MFNFLPHAVLLQNMMSEKEVRVRELEQALRESVRLTAERETHFTSREDNNRQLEQLVSTHQMLSSSMKFMN